MVVLFQTIQVLDRRDSSEYAANVRAGVAHAFHEGDIAMPQSRWDALKRAGKGGRRKRTAPEGATIPHRTVVGPDRVAVNQHTAGQCHARHTRLCAPGMWRRGVA